MKVEIGCPAGQPPTVFVTLRGASVEKWRAFLAELAAATGARARVLGDNPRYFGAELGRLAAELTLAAAPPEEVVKSNTLD